MRSLCLYRLEYNIETRTVENTPSPMMATLKTRSAAKCTSLSLQIS